MFNSAKDEFWNTFTDFSSEDSSQGSPSPLSSTLSLISLVPDFANPLPTSMDSVTIDSLRINGVLSLPSESLQRALLQSFVECVQPAMPILEWQNFLNSIYGRGNGHGSISLLLFHAVMFSATTFVDLRHLHAAGYSNRREAHESFFQKAKLLYQANYEQDTLTIVQAMLLLTYRVDAKDGDDSSHWIGVAISMATSIGLLQDPAGTRNFDHSAKLWKRVAWACYTTDCLISLRLRCRPNIHGMGFSHQILTEDDFEFYSLPSENQIISPNCSIAYNTNAQKELAHIYIANTRLCICISEVLDFRGKVNHIYASTGSPIQRNNRDNTDKATRVSISEYKLADWADSLPPSCHAPSPDSSNADDPTIAVQRSLLHLQFYTTIAILHQLQPFPSSKFCVQHAASQITLIASELHIKKLHDRLSITGVTAILVALIIHMSQLKASPSPKRNQAIENFQSCLEVMGSLRDVYWEAESVTEWASKAIM
ncbi:hypothetical protein N7476_007131 [Penicillium atrosanguineum]|uniref:Xylanolytic transcriptional activator regulatory domain-containing protein n=1 Tax=Penicillium atrosanguineum TaxID=1132637 RepID=A0A9W9PTS1_9EURO|nr:hypothetical protein N7526_006674 [Penicillium atrosanguineum]KAJ5311271.1 hypothetical protein N7476_007131 [Penicillium atrosanguineum]